MKNNQQVGLSAVLRGLLIVLGLIFTNPSYAALPIAECKTFLDDELELLCLQQSIAAKITDELPFYVGDARRNFSAEDIEFIATQVISLSPDGSVNYEIHTPRAPCYYSNHGLVCHQAVSTHSVNSNSGTINSGNNLNKFMDRILEGEILSDDDPELTYYEMKLVISYGQAQVLLKKRSFSAENVELLTVN